MRVVEVADVNGIIDQMVDNLRSDPYYIQSEEVRKIADFAIDTLNLSRENLLNVSKEVSTRRYRNV